ncbi:MAG: hypothetical protein Q9209_007847 [Squamulea sp. 1 TL-2023]
MAHSPPQECDAARPTSSVSQSAPTTVHDTQHVLANDGPPSTSTSTENCNHRPFDSHGSPKHYEPRDQHRDHEQNSDVTVLSHFCRQLDKSPLNHNKGDPPSQEPTAESYESSITESRGHEAPSSHFTGTRSSKTRQRENKSTDSLNGYPGRLNLRSMIGDHENNQTRCDAPRNSSQLDDLDDHLPCDDNNYEGCRKHSMGSSNHPTNFNANAGFESHEDPQTSDRPQGLNSQSSKAAPRIVKVHEIVANALEYFAAKGLPIIGQALAELLEHSIQDERFRSLINDVLSGKRSHIRVKNFDIYFNTAMKGARFPDAPGDDRSDMNDGNHGLPTTHDLFMSSPTQSIIPHFTPVNERTTVSVPSNIEPAKHGSKHPQGTEQIVDYGASIASHGSEQPTEKQKQVARTGYGDDEKKWVVHYLKREISRGNYTDSRWVKISRKLLKHGISRSPLSIKAWWSRYGRAENGLDERRNPQGRKLVTSKECPAERRKNRRLRKHDQVNGLATKK